MVHTVYGYRPLNLSRLCRSVQQELTIFFQTVFANVFILFYVSMPKVEATPLSVPSFNMPYQCPPNDVRVSPPSAGTTTHPSTHTIRTSTACLPDARPRRRTRRAPLRTTARRWPGPWFAVPHLPVARRGTSTRKAFGRAAALSGRREASRRSPWPRGTASRVPYTATGPRFTRRMDLRHRTGLRRSDRLTDLRLSCLSQCRRRLP